MLELFALGPLSFGSIGDARAMSPEEIERYQIANLRASQQAQHSQSYWMLSQNFQRPDPTPLDERFAAFKVRLAAAMEKHGVTAST